MSNTKICPKCNQVNPIQAASCPRCGRRFQSTAPQNSGALNNPTNQQGFNQPPNVSQQQLSNNQTQNFGQQPNLNQPNLNQTNSNQPFPNQQPKKSSAGWWIVGGTVGVSVIGVVVLFVAIVIIAVIVAANDEETSVKTTSQMGTSSTSSTASATSYSLANTLPGGWVNSKGIKNVFFKDGKFAQADSTGSVIGGAYKITDAQTVLVQLSQNGKTGSTTFKVSVIDDQHITIDGLQSTRTGYDK